MLSKSLCRSFINIENVGSLERSDFHQCFQGNFSLATATTNRNVLSALTGEIFCSNASGSTGTDDCNFNRVDQRKKSSIVFITNNDDALNGRKSISF